jgi:alkanesulfonate monooxygenase SsuD/methylene tetrahydromethanopterin reductase-like flavin-dependent oxidoreductase (luciferase family)
MSSATASDAVTCPTRRYHPAIVAQAAATIAVMSEGRFTLGLEGGERLNEHGAAERESSKPSARASP